MLVETGQVVAARQDTAWVVCDSLTACRRCAAGRGCGGAYMGRLLGDRQRQVAVRLDGRRVEVGERVQFSLDESFLMRGSVLAYLLPLAGLLSGVLLGQVVAGEGGAIAGAVPGFLLGWALARLAAGRLLPGLHRAARLR